MATRGTAAKENNHTECVDEETGQQFIHTQGSLKRLCIFDILIERVNEEFS